MGEACDAGGQDGLNGGLEVFLPDKQAFHQKSHDGGAFGEEQLPGSQDLAQQCAIDLGQVDDIDGASGCAGDLVRERLERLMPKGMSGIDGYVDVAVGAGLSGCQ